MSPKLFAIILTCLLVETALAGEPKRVLDEAAQARKPFVVELWPGKVPDETGEIGPEREVMSPALDHRQVEVMDPTRMIKAPFMGLQRFAGLQSGASATSAIQRRR